MEANVIEKSNDRLSLSFSFSSLPFLRLFSRLVLRFHACMYAQNAAPTEAMGKEASTTEMSYRPHLSRSPLFLSFAFSPSPLRLRIDERVTAELFQRQVALFLSFILLSFVLWFPSLCIPSLSSLSSFLFLFLLSRTRADIPLSLSLFFCHRLSCMCFVCASLHYTFSSTTAFPSFISFPLFPHPLPSPLQPLLCLYTHPTDSLPRPNNRLGVSRIISGQATANTGRPTWLLLEAPSRNPKQPQGFACFYAQVSLLCVAYRAAQPPDSRDWRVTPVTAPPRAATMASRVSQNLLRC